jgi:hypothetical protein
MFNGKQLAQRHTLYNMGPFVDWKKADGIKWKWIDYQRNNAENWIISMYRK